MDGIITWYCSFVETCGILKQEMAWKRSIGIYYVYRFFTFHIRLGYGYPDVLNLNLYVIRIWYTFWAQFFIKFFGDKMGLVNESLLLIHPSLKEFFNTLLIKWWESVYIYNYFERQKHFWNTLSLLKKMNWG